MDPTRFVTTTSQLIPEVPFVLIKYRFQDILHILDDWNYRLGNDNLSKVKREICLVYNLTKA